MPTVPEYLRLWREAKGLSQLALAERLGYQTPAYVSRMELPNAHPPRDYILRVALVSGRSASGVELAHCLIMGGYAPWCGTDDALYDDLKPLISVYNPGFAFVPLDRQSLAVLTTLANSRVEVRSILRAAVALQRAQKALPASFVSAYLEIEPHEAEAGFAWETTWRSLQEDAEEIRRNALQVAEQMMDVALAGEIGSRIMVMLRLSLSDLAQMLQTPLATVEAWYSAADSPDADRILRQGRAAGTRTVETIDSVVAKRLHVANAALSRLEEMFVPVRLPEIIRRPAQGFGGERALDWILRGEIDKVVEHYDLTLAYQG
jgi:transcriptional regulator with XRE-family HTH domain